MTRKEYLIQSNATRDLTRPSSMESTVDLDARLSAQRELPADLPRSLNDRRGVRHSGVETEMYDGWQGSAYHARIAFN